MAVFISLSYFCRSSMRVAPAKATIFVGNWAKAPHFATLHGGLRVGFANRSPAASVAAPTATCDVAAASPNTGMFTYTDSQRPGATSNVSWNTPTLPSLPTRRLNCFQAARCGSPGFLAKFSRSSKLRQY